MVRIVFRELTRKDLFKKIDTGEEFRIYPSIFPSEFCFFACNAPMICIGLLHGIFHIDASKSDSVVYISKEHYSFQSTGHVAMVRFEFQLSDVENECY